MLSTVAVEHYMLSQFVKINGIFLGLQGSITKNVA